MRTARVIVANGWCRVWDVLLDDGVRGTKAGQSLFSYLCRPVFGDRSCPICNEVVANTFFEHICQEHVNVDIGTLPTILEGDSSGIVNLSKLCFNLL